MKRLIAIILLAIILISTPAEKVKAGEVVVGTEIGLALMELILGTAVSYDIAQKIDAFFPSAYHLTFSGKPYDGILMTEEQIKAFEQANQSLDDKMSVLYEGSDVKVQYDGDSQVYESTTYNGQEYFLNPYLVNVLVNANAWAKLMNVNQSLKTMSIGSVYIGLQALKQDITQKQVETSLAYKQCMTIVGTAIRSAYISLVPSGSVNETMLSSDRVVQALKYENLPSWAQLKTIGSNNYYITLQNSRYYILTFARDTYLTPYTSTTYDVKNPTGSLIKSIYWDSETNQYGENGQTNLSIAIDANLIYTNVVTEFPINNPYGLTEFPYDYFTHEVTFPIPQDPNIGVVTGLVDNTLTVPNTGVIGQTKEEIVTGFGGVSDGVYEDVKEVTLPQEYLDAQSEYSSGVLGWLQRLWDGIISIPRAILDGLLSILKQAMEWLFVPSSVFIDELVAELTLTIENKTGILTYPMALAMRLLGQLLTIQSSDCILTLPAMNIFGNEIFNGQTFNLSEFVKKEGIDNFYQIYLKFTDVVMIGFVLKLSTRKWKDFINSEVS